MGCRRKRRRWPKRRAPAGWLGADDAPLARVICGSPRGKPAWLKENTERTSAYLVLDAPDPHDLLLNAKARSAPRGEDASRLGRAPALKQCPSAQPLSTGCSRERTAPTEGPPPRAGPAHPPQGWEDRLLSLSTCSLCVRTLPQLHPRPTQPRAPLGPNSCSREARDELGQAQSDERLREGL